MKSKYFLIFLMVLAIFANCKRVMVPPAIDLKTLEPVGMITFKCNVPGNLAEYVTQKFIEQSTKDQKLVKFVQLGKEDILLKEVEQQTLDINAIKTIADKYKVKSIVSGEIEISDIHPKINVVPGLWYVGAQADVSATLIVRLIDGADGYTIWSKSARAKRTVGHVSFMSKGHFSFDAEDPENAYGPLAEELIKKVTKDFRVTYHW